MTSSGKHSAWVGQYLDHGRSSRDEMILKRALLEVIRREDRALQLELEKFKKQNNSLVRYGNRSVSRTKNMT
jgi:hypothetical protein